jgi:hypothetical protein
VFRFQTLSRTAFAIAALALVSACGPNPNGGGETQTGTIVGTVVDASTNQPIPNAFISVGSLITRTLTPADQGKFTLINVPIGQQTLRVHALGYLDDVEQIQVQTNQTSFAGNGGTIQMNSTLGPIPGPSPAASASP